MPLTIIIVGAGIGGFTAAIALRQAGHQVTVFEKHENKREVGFAVSLPPNSTRVLRSLGLDFKKVRASKFGGIAFAKAERSEYEILAQLQDDAEDQYGAPSLAAHRVDLHNALRELATGPGAGTPVNVLEGITVTAYSPSAGSVTLEDGRTVTADVIVAADGVKSTAHKHILGEERPATLSRLSNVRFCVPTETMLQNPLLKKTLPNGSDYPTLYRGADPDVMLLRYPCRDHTLQNFGCYALTRSPSPTTAAAHWTTEPTLSILLHRLSGFDPTIREIAHLADPTDMYLWKVLDRDPLPAYHRGRMILLGDAAHAMQPTFGMGATFAVEDAGVLGVVLRDVHDREEVEGRLEVWAELRWKRASAMVLLSRCERLDGNGPLVSEQTKGKLREIWTEEGEWPELTRQGVNAWAMGFDCLADAERVVGKMFGGK